MRIPRYGLYWRASGLWLILRIPYPYRAVLGAVVMLVGLPLVHVFVEPTALKYVAHFAAVIAGLGLLCWTD